MRKVLIAALSAFVLAAAGMAVPVQADPDGKVTICHFPGHDGDHRPLKGDRCEKAKEGDAIAIEISVHACPAHGLECTKRPPK
jgi:hypothetical protein